MSDPRVERWLAALLATPGLTSIRDLDDARRVHVDEALAAASVLACGPVVDVGSGGGSPGIPLAAARPELEFSLLEASRKKCDFLDAWARVFPNVSVVCARAEDHARGAGRDAYAAAVARALAPPAVAVEWCLPLISPGGMVVLYTGEPELARVEAAAGELGGGEPSLVRLAASERRHLVVVPKLEPTPTRFPRRAGIARKRPLA